MHSDNILVEKASSLTLERAIPPKFRIMFIIYIFIELFVDYMEIHAPIDSSRSNCAFSGLSAAALLGRVLARRENVRGTEREGGEGGSFVILSNPQKPPSFWFDGTLKSSVRGVVLADPNRPKMAPSSLLVNLAGRHAPWP